MIGFIIWTTVALFIAGIGVWSWNSKKAAGFYSGVKPPEVTDVKKYNHAVGTIWFVYAALFEAVGVPLMFLGEHKLYFLIPMLGTVAITVALPIAYNKILKRYRKGSLSQ